MAGISYPSTGSKKSIPLTTQPAPVKVSASQTRSSVAAISGGSSVVNPNVSAVNSGASFLAQPVEGNSLLEMARQTNPIMNVVKTQSQATAAIVAKNYQVPQNPNVKSIQSSVASTPASNSFPKGNKNVANVGTTPKVIG